MAVCTAILLLPALPTFAINGDTEVTVGSNDFIFSQNKQNEPYVAINPQNPLIVAAGANDNIDLEACNAGNPTTCPFTDRVGLSGVQFSLDGGITWVQPTYTGLTARFCLGPAPCVPVVGPIGTLPWYFENGLVSDGDPIVAFGPRPGGGGFSWSNGVRLYYSNLTSNVTADRQEQEFKGFEAIAVSRTDDPAAAAADAKNAWIPPVIVSKQSSATFSDKETIWADNAATSRFFGNVYICWVSFRSLGGAPEPVIVARSTDGGDTWSERQVTPAANTGLGHGRQGCTVRTDSNGVVYVFYRGGAFEAPSVPPFQDRAIMMARSFDGGVRFERPRAIAPVTDCGRRDVAQGRLTFDGVAGARTNSFPIADVANGAPTGTGATNRIVLTYCQGPTPSTTSPGPNEKARVAFSTDGGETWTAVDSGAESADRPDFPAVAISPDGTDVYLTYMAFLQPWQPTTAAPRLMQGVVRHIDWSSLVSVTPAWTTLHRGVVGDARGSSANSLVSEFLGDYNAIAATNSKVVAVWNDVRNAASCAAINTWRQNRVNFILGVGPNPGAPPAPQSACAPTFGNSDIFGISLSDPTP